MIKKRFIISDLRTTPRSNYRFPKNGSWSLKFQYKRVKFNPSPKIFFWLRRRSQPIVFTVNKPHVDDTKFSLFPIKKTFACVRYHVPFHVGFVRFCTFCFPTNTCTNATGVPYTRRTHRGMVKPQISIPHNGPAWVKYNTNNNYDLLSTRHAHTRTPTHTHAGTYFRKPIRT